jgi:hypothetical protein
MPRAIAVILVVVGFIVMLFAWLVAIVLQGWPGRALGFGLGLGFVGMAIGIAGMVWLANIARAEKYARISAKLSLPRTEKPSEHDRSLPR